MSTHLFDAAPGAHQAATCRPPSPTARRAAPPVRCARWQEEALAAYFEREPRDFLAAATPGAGKTTFALRLAKELLARGTVDRVTVVAPTDHLKRQWAEAAERVAIHLNPVFKNCGRLARAALARRGPHLRAGRRRRGAAQAAHRVGEDARHPRRGAPRRRRALLGRRDAGVVRQRHAPPAAHRDAVPQRHRADPVRQLRAGRRTASAPRCPTTPTATAGPSRTASCGPCSSWSTAARCAGAPRPARR